MYTKLRGGLAPKPKSKSKSRSRSKPKSGSKLLTKTEMKKGMDKINTIIDEEIKRFIKDSRSRSGSRSGSGSGSGSKSPGINKLVNKMKRNFENNIKKEGIMFWKHTVKTIKNALPYSKQNKNLLENGIVKLKNGGHFIVDSIKIKPRINTPKGSKSKQIGSGSMRGSGGIDMRMLLVASAIISFFTHIHWDQQNAENAGIGWLASRSTIGAGYDSIVAGPARQYLYAMGMNINGPNSFLTQLLAGMMPYIGGALFTQMHPMWGIYGGMGYEIGGVAIYSGRAAMERYWIPSDGWDNLGEDIWNGIVKYSGPLKVIANKLRDWALKPTMNKLNELYKLVKDAVKSFFKTMKGLIDQVLIFFKQALPRMVKDALGVPLKKFKNVICEATNSMGWLSKSTFNEKLRIMLDCDKHLSNLEKHGKLGNAMWCDSEGCMLGDKSVPQTKLDGLTKLLNQHFKELHQGGLKQRLIPSARAASLQWAKLQRKDPTNIRVLERMSRIQEGRKRRGTSTRGTRGVGLVPRQQSIPRGPSRSQSRRYAGKRGH